MAQETIYSARDAFFLEINGMDYKIREPIGWNKAEILIERDEEKHGISFNYPSKDLQLEFGNEPEEETGNRSKQLIDDEVAINGPDAQIFIKFGLYDGVTLTTEYTRRRLDIFDDYVNGLHKTRTKTTKDGIDTTAEDLKDVSVNLEQTLTVFDNAMPGTTPATKTNINLHSKALAQTFRAETQAEITEFVSDAPDEEVEIFDGEIGYGQIRLSERIQDGLVDDLNLPTGFSEFDPIEFERGNYRILNPSTKFTNFKAKLEARIVYKKTGVADTFDVTSFVNVNGTDYQVGTQTVSSFGGNVLETFRIDHSIDFNLPDDTNASNSNNLVYFYFEIDFTTGDPSTRIAIDTVEVYGDNKASYFEISGETFFKPSIIEGFKLKDALDYMFKALFEEDGRFKSTLYDTGGEAEDIIIANGNKIRGLNDNLKAPVLTIEDAFEACNLMHGIGQGFEYDTGGTRQVVWERYPHFYRDVEILSLLDRTSSFEYLSDKEAYPNLIGLKYPRLTVREDGGSNTIDEFNSEIEIIPPIERSSKKVRLKSNWRLSGYDAETSRRLSVKPTESYRSDDDIFAFYHKAALNLSNIKMIFDYEEDNDSNQLFIYFREQDYKDEFKYVSKITVAGDTEPIIGGQNVNGDYDYNPTLFEFVDTGTPTETYVKVPATADPAVDNDGSAGAREVDGLTITTAEARAERNQDFTTVTGVIDPDSSYNLRAHPLRAFVNHAALFNRALFYKPATAKYKVQFKKENRDLVTQLDNLDPSPIGDTSFALMDESDGIQKQNADQGRYLVDPRKVKVQADISFDEILILKDAIENQDDPLLNGYITTIDNDGNQVQVYPDKIQGNPNQNFYEIIGKLKGNYYD